MISGYGLSDLAGRVREAAVPLPSIDDEESFAAHFDCFGDAKIVLLGEAHLARQFDALVWFEQTRPVVPLPGAAAEGAPDIYPFGV
jgi:erythromycin esterase-like protein